MIIPNTWKNKNVPNHPPVVDWCGLELSMSSSLTNKAATLESTQSTWGNSNLAMDRSLEHHHDKCCLKFCLHSFSEVMGRLENLVRHVSFKALLSTWILSGASCWKYAEPSQANSGDMSLSHLNKKNQAFQNCFFGLSTWWFRKQSNVYWPYLDA